MDMERRNMEYPHYILDRPNGQDKYEGESQTLLAKSIADYITNRDEEADGRMPKIIGIEGPWGVGKSNVIKILEKELRAKSYYFFEYDAWSNQEELQRRSFLEQLTRQLVNDKVLEGKTTFTTMSEELKEGTWKERKTWLFAKRKISVSERYPMLNGGIVVAGIAYILTPITTLIASFWQVEFPLLVRVCIALFPIIGALIYWGVMAKRYKKYRNFSFLRAIYVNKVEKEHFEEIVSEEEPTVEEFKRWMIDVSKDLNPRKCKKLVVVYDNMDRLPAEKVRQLWSLIHTFFAETIYDNIWVIIPFDKANLKRAFDDEREDGEKLAQSFVEKVFPFTYTVPKPVISDYKAIFSSFFVEAFGDDQKESEEIVYRLYRLCNPEANIRKIITFFNSLVSMYKTQELIGNKLRLESISIYLLRKDDICNCNDVNDCILSGDYLGIIENIVPNDDKLKEDISSLVYGVSSEHAKQIPLKEYINKCIDKKEGCDINKYAKDKNFFVILKEVYDGTDIAKLPLMIETLNALDGQTNDVLPNLWEDMGNKFLRVKITQQELTNPSKILLQHVCVETKRKIVNYLLTSWHDVEDFKGDKYVQCVRDLKNIDDIKDFVVLQPQKVSSQIFIDAVREAGKDYKEFQLEVDADAVDATLSNVGTRMYKEYEVVKVLKEDNFSEFPQLLSYVKQAIANNLLSINTGEIGQYFSTYRCLSSKDSPLGNLPNGQIFNNYVVQLKDEGRKSLEDGYFDLIAISLALHRAMEIDDEDIPQVAEIMDYYKRTDDLIIGSLNGSNPILKKVLAHMIRHHIGNNLSLESVLPKYSNIKTQYSLTDEELLDYLNQYSFDFLNHPSNMNEAFLKRIIPNSSFYEASVTVNNNLTIAIDRFAMNVLTNSTTAPQLFQNLKRNIPAYKYWYTLIENLILDDSIRHEFSILNELAGLIYEYVATNLSDNYMKKIIKYSDGEAYKDKVLQIRNDICNDRRRITPLRFVNIENNLRLHGDLNQKANAVVNKIIKQVIGNNHCKIAILNNASFYKGLISTATDVDEFKNILRRSWSEEEYQQILED